MLINKECDYALRIIRAIYFDDNPVITPPIHKQKGKYTTKYYYGDIKNTQR